MHLFGEILDVAHMELSPVLCCYSNTCKVLVLANSYPIENLFFSLSFVNGGMFKNLMRFLMQ